MVNYSYKRDKKLHLKVGEIKYGLQNVDEEENIWYLKSIMYKVLDINILLDYQQQKEGHSSAQRIIELVDK